MTKSKNKTIETSASVEDFLGAIDNPKRKLDSLVINELMCKLTGETPKMWGKSIVGFGTYHYRYDSGREGDFMKVGFSPRKQNLTLYIMPGFERYGDLMGKLGKYKIGKSCLYINKLEDINQDILSVLIQSSYDYMTIKYG